MRRIFLSLCLGLLAGCSTFAAQAKDNQSAPKRLEASDVLKMLDNKEKFFYLDVREPRELAQYGTLKNAVNIPLGQLESRLSEIPKGVKVVTACQRGVRAGRAAELLTKHGWEVIGICGMFDWKDKGVPLVFPSDKAESNK